MAQIQMTNFGDTTLSAGISATDTAITFPVAHSGRFPTLTAGDWFYAVLADTLGNREIIKVTAHSAGVGSFTALRAQEGTTGLVFPVGSVLSLRMTVQSFVDWVSAVAAPRDSPAFTGNGSIAGTLAMGSAFEDRNAIINSDCLITQRSPVTLVNSSSQYGAVDRFWGNISATTVTSGTIQAGALGGFVSGMGVGLYNLTTTGVTSGAIGQRIEASRCRRFNGKTVTISGNIYNSLGVTVNAAVVLYKPSALDTWATNLTGMTEVGRFTFSATNGAYTPFSGQIAVGASDAANGLCALVNFTVDSGVTAKEIWLSEFRVEEGSKQTPAESQHIGQELALCQRYYEPFNVSCRGAAFTGMSTTARFLVDKRAIPTVARLGDWQTAAEAGTTSSYIVTQEVILSNPTTNATAVGGIFTASAEL